MYILICIIGVSWQGFRGWNSGVLVGGVWNRFPWELTGVGQMGFDISSVKLGKILVHMIISFLPTWDLDFVLIPFSVHLSSL